MRKKNPPPPLANRRRDRWDQETYEVQPSVRIVRDGIVLSFDKETQWLLMTPGGARKLAKALMDHAEKLAPPLCLDWESDHRGGDGKRRRSRAARGYLPMDSSAPLNNGTSRLPPD